MGRVNFSRYIYPLFLSVVILCSFIPIVLAIDLIKINEYIAFQDILHKWYLPYSYFSRIIISNLDYFNFNIFHFLSSLLSNLSIINSMVLFCVIYMFAASKEAFMKQYNKRWISIVLVYAVTYILMGIILIVGFSLTTLNNIISLFQGVAYLMLFSHLCMSFLSVYYLYEFIKDYLFNKK